MECCDAVDQNMQMLTVYGEQLPYTKTVLCSSMQTSCTASLVSESEARNLKPKRPATTIITNRA